MIHIVDLYKVYAIGQTRLHALNGVSFDIPRGTFACVVGRSGSGKSTLLNMMAGLEKPSRGIIEVAGQRLERLNEAKLVKYRLDNVGFIFQSFNLFASLTALENVAMPLVYRGVPRSKRLKIARDMMSAVGLESHMKHKPSQMSGGQQQRVGIARALVTQPKIIFADEPTGNLDSRTSGDILDMMRNICATQGLTMVMVTHDQSIAALAEQRIQLLDGKIDTGDVVTDAHIGPTEGVEEPTGGYAPPDPAQGGIASLTSPSDAAASGNGNIQNTIAL